MKPWTHPGKKVINSLAYRLAEVYLDTFDFTEAFQILGEDPTNGETNQQFRGIMGSGSWDEALISAATRRHLAALARVAAGQGTEAAARATKKILDILCKGREKKEENTEDIEIIEEKEVW